MTGIPARNVDNEPNAASTSSDWSSSSTTTQRPRPAGLDEQRALGRRRDDRRPLRPSPLRRGTRDRQGERRLPGPGSAREDEVLAGGERGGNVRVDPGGQPQP